MASPIVHHRAWVGPDVEVGPGTAVRGSAAITTNEGVARQASVNLQSTVAHDCSPGELVTLVLMTAIRDDVTLGGDVTLNMAASTLP